MSPVPGAADLERKNAYWIEFGKREEQERIIKLLDTDYWHHRIWGNSKPTCVPDCLTCEQIALIKGENK